MRGERRRISAWGGQGRGMLALLLLALLAFPAVSQASGGIAGTITETPPGNAAIQGIEACAFTLNPNPASEEGEGEYGCAVTGASGEYEIDGLNSGSYFVCFAMPLVTALNFVGECFDGKTYEQEPTSVTVAEGAVTHHIDAALERGAVLEGTVTQAGTGTGLEGAIVCAMFHTGGSEPGEVVSCTKAVAGGAFTLAGVPAGTFDVRAFYFGHEEFGSGYLGGHLRSESTPVTVAAHETKTGLNLVLTLTQFKLGEGSPGGGEGGPGEAPLGGNSGARGGGTSPAPGLSLATSRIAVGPRGRARVAVVCAGTSACRGRIALRQKGALRGHRRHMVVLGGVRYSLAPGASRVLTLRLDARGRRDLRAHHGRLDFHAAIVPSSPAHAVVSVKGVVLVAAGRGGTRHAR